MMLRCSRFGQWIIFKLPLEVFFLLMSLSFLEQFFTLYQNKIFWGHLVLSYPRPEFSHLSKESWFHLETLVFKSQDLSMCLLSNEVSSRIRVHTHTRARAKGCVFVNIKQFEYRGWGDRTEIRIFHPILVQSGTTWFLLPLWALLGLILIPKKHLGSLGNP